MPYDWGSTASSHVTGVGERRQGGPWAAGGRLAACMRELQAIKQRLKRLANRLARGPAGQEGPGYVTALVMNWGAWEGCSPPGGFGQSFAELGEQGQPAGKVDGCSNRAPPPMSKPSLAANFTISFAADLHGDAAALGRGMMVAARTHLWPAQPEQLTARGALFGPWPPQECFLSLD